MAEVIRAALDRYLSEGHVDVERAPSTTFGAVPDADVPSRDEWSRE